MLTQRQRWFYFGLCRKAVAIKMHGRSTWTKAEEEQVRHEITRQALGCHKSSTQFTARDFDLVKATLLAIIRPGDLNAQLQQLRQPHKRAMYRLKELMGELEVGWNYVNAIIHTMNAEGQLGSDQVDNLDSEELKKVIIALEQEYRRSQPGWEAVLERRKQKRKRREYVLKPA